MSYHHGDLPFFHLIGLGINFISCSSERSTIMTFKPLSILTNPESSIPRAENYTKQWFVQTKFRPLLRKSKITSWGHLGHIGPDLSIGGFVSIFVDDSIAGAFPRELRGSARDDGSA
jgi:hypothetical protein